MRVLVLCMSTVSWLVCWLTLMDHTRPERLKANEMRSATLNAIVECGSSDRDLEDFVTKINGLQNYKKLTDVYV